MMHVDVNLAVVVMPAPCGVGDWSGVGVPGPVGGISVLPVQLYACPWLPHPCVGCGGVGVSGSWVECAHGEFIVVSLLFDPVVFVGMSGFRAGIS